MLNVTLDIEHLASHKVCSQCKEEKHLDEFYNHITNKDGKSGRCKQCTITTFKRYYQNRKLFKAKHKEII